MREEFDVFVIGSGIAGQSVAKACVENKLKVAISDHRVYGGTCANRGCDPKKVILGVTEVMKLSQNLNGKGVSELPELSWKDVMTFKKQFTDAVPASTEKKMKKLGIAMYHQSPHFLDSNTLSVEGKTVKAKKIVIASGLMPRPLDMEGASLALLSDDFMELKELPESMIFIGAGYIGMEFAHMAARFGVKVTVLDLDSRPLSVFDKDMVEYIRKTSEDIGIEFIFNAEVTSIKELRKNKRVNFSVKGKKQDAVAELIFNTSGRIPSIDMLDLEKGNVATSSNGIAVNEYLQNTTNPDVYACGDVSANAVPLTPFSSLEGKMVAHNILNGNEKKADFPVTPSVVFTLPNLASVGMSEEEAKNLNIDIEIVCQDASAFYNAKRINEKIYAYKTVVDKKTNKILGAHLVGPEAGEVINLFSMAIYNKMTVAELKEMIFTYPSWGADIPYMF